TDNGDGSKELFRYDVVNSTPDSPKFRQLTFTPVASLFGDQRANVFFSYPDNTGNVVTFAPIANLLYPNLPIVSEALQAVLGPIGGQSGDGGGLANAGGFWATRFGRGFVGAVCEPPPPGPTNSSSPPTPPYQIDGVSLSVQGLAARLLY